MKILVIGSGGREHTLAWKIAQSPLATAVFVAPGNAGTALIATNVAIEAGNFEGVGAFVKENDIGLVVVGPEVPLVDGLADYFQSDSALKQVKFVGPAKDGARLEGSKEFSKAFMRKYAIPTAVAATFTPDRLRDGMHYIDICTMPVVLKADGLAAGKGVVIAHNAKEAKDTLHDMLIGKKFGEAGSKVLIEQFLPGVELSVFVLTDGENYVILPEAKDYKRIGEGDTGPNTGGMGAVSPVKFADALFMKKVENKIIKPTIDGLKKEGINYKGFIFIGLMNVNGEPYVIEYNVRMGDPETQCVIPRIKSDLVSMLDAAATGRLGDYRIEVYPHATAGVVLVSGGYPGHYEKGKPISGLADADAATGQVIHAGTKQRNGEMLTDGGRVLTVVGTGDAPEEALKSAYDTIKVLSWEGMYYRKDIGRDIPA